MTSRTAIWPVPFASGLRITGSDSAKYLVVRGRGARCGLGLGEPLRHRAGLGCRHDAGRHVDAVAEDVKGELRCAKDGANDLTGVKPGDAAGRRRDVVRGFEYLQSGQRNVAVLHERAAEHHDVADRLDLVRNAMQAHGMRRAMDSSGRRDRDIHVINSRTTCSGTTRRSTRRCCATEASSSACSNVVSRSSTNCRRSSRSNMCIRIAYVVVVSVVPRKVPVAVGPDRKNIDGIAWVKNAVKHRNSDGSDVLPKMNIDPYQKNW